MRRRAAKRAVAHVGLAATLVVVVASDESSGRDGAREG